MTTDAARGVRRQRSAIVSGGTGGLGSAVVARLADSGWRVVVPWVVEDEVSRLPVSDRVVPLRADLFDSAAVAAVVAEASSNDDAPLAAVVNLVGGFAMGGRVHEVPEGEFDGLIRLNLTPTHLLTRAALPRLIDNGGGSVLAVSARAAFAPFAGASAYITAKAAVWAFVNSLAVEYARDGIRANAILPSVIDTPGNRESQPNSDRQGWVLPEDIAEVVAFLVSDAAAAVTGAQIPVSGVG